MNRTSIPLFLLTRVLAAFALNCTLASPAPAEDLLYGRIQQSDGAGNMQLIQRSNFFRPPLSTQQGAFILNIQERGSTSSRLTAPAPALPPTPSFGPFQLYSSAHPKDGPSFVLDGRSIELAKPQQYSPRRVDDFFISPSSRISGFQWDAQSAGIDETRLIGGISEFKQTSRSIPLKGVFEDGILIIGEKTISIPHDQPMSFAVKSVPIANGVRSATRPTFTVNDQVFEWRGEEDRTRFGFWINDKEVASNPAGQLNFAQIGKNKPQSSFTIDGQEFIAGKLLPWRTKPSLTVDGESLLSGKLLPTTSPLLASEDTFNPTSWSAYRAVVGKLSPTLDPSALPSRKLLSWDEWYEQVAELVRTPLIEAMNKAHNPKGTNTIRITVTRDHRITIQMKSPGNPEFDSAVIAAYESLQGNVELEFPDGSMRSKVTFLTDHKHNEDSHCIDVDVISLKGDTE